MKGFIVAGVTSGVGKTTVSIALISALVERGYRVQPFKVGPDYIDPSYHYLAAGLPCRNLDSWLLEPSAIRELFHRAMDGKDIAVVEGVMGLYDGASGDSEAGSTAELAKLLGLPVILTIDASKVSRSVGAIALGFREFDAQLDLAGVILNGIAGSLHLELARPSLEQAGVRYLGYLPGNSEFQLPERHLGLVPTAEGRLADSYCRRLGLQASETIELDQVLAVADRRRGPPPDDLALFPREPQARKATIAVALDEAFNFYYPDSLDLLRAWGAEIATFSPLEDRDLPDHTSGVYLGGGFPELFAEDLSGNAPIHAALQAAAADGVPIYAECGGLMYLGEGIVDAAGRHHPMVGLLSCRSEMGDMRLSLGYRRVRAIQDSPLMRAGEVLRGHEFHFSSLDPGPSDVQPAYEVLDQPGRREGFIRGSVLASYVHLHFGSAPNLAPRFVTACRRSPRSGYD